MSALDRLSAVFCAVTLFVGVVAWGNYYVKPHDAYYDDVMACMAEKAPLGSPESREAYRACHGATPALPAPSLPALRPPPPMEEPEPVFPDPCGLESVLCPGEPGYDEAVAD